LIREIIAIVAKERPPRWPASFGPQRSLYDRRESASKDDPMNVRASVTRSLPILAFAAFAFAVGLAVAAWRDPDAGTIPADHSVREALVRANSGGRPVPSKSRRKRPNFDDVSPGARGGKGLR
jgi:hypothetical protein